MPAKPHQPSSAIRLLASLLLLLTTVSAVTGPQAASATITTALPPSASLRAFQLVAPDSGWVLIDNGLFWTNTAGKDWRQLSPPLAPSAQIAAAWFSDPQHGWLVAATADANAASFQLIRTSDSGQTWQAMPLPLPTDVAALAGDLYLQFIDAHTGWLVVKQDTSSLFSLGTLFATTNGGQTWQRLALPAGGPIHFSTAQDGILESGPPAHEQFATHDGGLTWDRQPKPPASHSLAEQSMATPQAGWSKSVTGECQADTCQLVTQLLQTSDGGATWSPLLLPGGQPSLQRNFPVPASPSSQPAAAADTATHNLVFNGDGFDTCMIGALPTLSDMQTWYTHSPYRARNLYLGGESLPNCGHLTFNYVQSLAQQGWVFIPTWVGPQPPCANVDHKMSFDPTIAYNQGLVNADLALDAAAELGFTVSGYSGTIIYYDIEHYNPPPPPNDLPCRRASQAFINGWTAGLHARGSLSGVYGSPCGSYVADMAGIPNVPDSVWLARWTHTSYDPNVSVFGLNCIDDSFWIYSQRLRQYTGGHMEQWGGATLNIDSDVLHGVVTTVRGNCVPSANQAALFVYPHFGGACVLKDVGSYPTVASLNLPNDAISSVRLGSNVVLRLCVDEFHGGVCEDFSDDAAMLNSHPIGDDEVLSATVQTTTVSVSSRVFLPAFTLNPTFAGVLNGGFENGPVDWTTTSIQQRQLIVPASAVAGQGVTPHTGGWLAWLGGADAESASLLQTLVVPASAPYLAYWHWLASTETGCSYDFATVWANGNAVDSYGLCASANTNGWVKHVVNLTPYAGTSITLRLNFGTDTNLTSSLYIDDLVFQSIP